MGTFAGHALPGSFLVIFGAWMTVKVLYGYFTQLYSRTKQSKAKDFHKVPCSVCVEGILKVIFTTIGIIGEIVTAFKHGQFAHLGNGQHATMFFFFGLSGVVDILLYHKVPLPSGSNGAALILAFTVEALLFNFHLHGRPELDIVIHTLLLYTVYATILCLLLEIVWSENILIKLATRFWVIVQGTWFWQVGFILYSPFRRNDDPGWDEEDEHQIMLTTILFAWHLAIILGVVFLTSVVIAHRVKKKYGDRVDCAELKPIHQEENENESESTFQDDIP